MGISVDSPEESRELAKKAGYTFPLLADPSTAAIRQYDLVHKGQSPDGHDIARPAEFLVDRNGIVRWRNITGDLRIRASPAQILEAARNLR